MDLEEDEIDGLLSKPGPNADEHHVWNAIMRLLRHNSSRAAFLPKRLRNIRLGLFEDSFFLEKFMPEVCMFRSWDFQTDSLLNEADHFQQTQRSIVEETQLLITPKFAIRSTKSLFRR